MITRRFLLSLIGAIPLLVGAAPPPLVPQPFVSGLNSPTEIAQPDDASGRLFVTEQGGTVRVIRQGQLLPTPFLDITQKLRVDIEQGLLGLAFDPLYAANGHFYIYYSRLHPGDEFGSDLVVERYTQSAANPDIADPASASLVIAIPSPGRRLHNGGKIAFGPDGYLYIGVGDGGTGGLPAQSLAEQRGKILRIAVDPEGGFSIPPTNPFVATPGALPEIWDYGLRNPWRFSFDRANGDIFIGDVGGGLWEEVNFEPAGNPGGHNFGWPVFEGLQCSNPPGGCDLDYTRPIIAYSRSQLPFGGIAVTGGYRYRGEALPMLQGYYVYGDLSGGEIWAAAPDAAGTWTPTLVFQSPASSGFVLSTFGQDTSGELYVADYVTGTISRLTPPATTIPRASNISTRGVVGGGDDVLIGGFVVGGTAPKTVVITAAGPSLAAAGISSPLPDPVLTLVRSSDGEVLAVNDDWQVSPAAARIAEAGLAPADPHESAIMVTLPPGAYTTVVSGAGGATTGVGIVGVYEVDHPETPLVNLSARGQVLAADNVMIGGFVIQGSGPQRVVVTAIGPSLAAAGVGDALQNPALTLVRMSDRSIIATNDDWPSSPDAAAIQALGLAPADAHESAVLLTLEPGAYTAIVSGVGGGTGVGIVAMYTVH